MARDHRRLRAFVEAHRLTLAIYKETQELPREEWYGLRGQMRRAAVSVASNIVEGSARRTTREYVHFLNVAFGSAAETSYLIDLASELGYLAPQARTMLNEQCRVVCVLTGALLRKMEQLMSEEARRQRPEA